MPCYDPRDNNERIVYRDGVNPNVFRDEIEDLKQRNSWLEAALCAIITELEKKNIANEIISQASKSGLIDIMDFWMNHSKEDETRLSKELHKFSEHEQAILKKILNKK